MNLEKLKEILNSKFPDDIKEHQLMWALAEEEDIIPRILQLLQQERASRKQMILEMNYELSRAFNYVTEAVFDKKKKGFNKEFLLGEIKNFYRKYKHGRLAIHTSKGSEWAKEHLKDVYDDLG